jgi:hypothetical protein
MSILFPSGVRFLKDAMRYNRVPIPYTALRLRKPVRENSGPPEGKVLSRCHEITQRLEFLKIMEFDDASSRDLFDHVSRLQ